jgi:hypothetical protein
MFDSPNTFEGNLQIFRDLFINRHGVCYKKSKLINLPLNKVQNDCKNRHGNLDEDYLLDQWKDGLQIDYKKLYGYNNVSAHEEINIMFLKR